MIKNKKRTRWKLVCFRILLCLSVSLLMFSTFTLNSSADESGNSSTVTYTHTHSGNSSSGGGCYGSPIYRTHYHTGTMEHGGGCYTSPYQQTFTGISTGCGCSGTGANGGRNPSMTGGNDGICSDCGHTLHSYQTCGAGAGQPFTYTATRYALSCGMTNGGRYPAMGVESYSLSCGLQPKNYGSMTVSNATPGWTSGNVTLSAEVNDPDGVLTSNGGPSFSTGDGTIVSSTNTSAEVSENGTYTLSLPIDGSKFGGASSQITITVSNIDRTAPTISADYDTTSPWLLTNTITVSADDLQPDGSQGSGLADEAYSFDGGATWTSSNTYEVTENTTVYIQVRDNCGNIADTSVTISNLDLTGPEITYTYSPDTWYNDDPPRSFTFTGSDPESGLDAEAYSYDEGATWTSMNTTYRSSAGDFIVYVRNAVGIITQITVPNVSFERPPAPVVGVGGTPGDGNGSGNGNGSGEGDGSSDETNGSDDKSDGADNDDGDDKSGNTDSENGANNGNKKDSGDDSDGNSGDDASGEGSDNDAWWNHLSLFNGQDSDTQSNNNNAPMDESSNKEPEEAIVYFEQVATSNAPNTLSTGSTSDAKPFYKTTAFVVAASTGGGLLGLGVLGLIILLMCSGVFLYSFDVNKYKLISILPIHRSTRGYCINLSNELIDRSYSSSYKIVTGPIFAKKHKNELLFVHTENEWIPLQIEKPILFELSSEYTDSDGILL